MSSSSGAQLDVEWGSGDRRRGTGVEEGQQGCDTWFTAISRAEAFAHLAL